MSDQSVDVWKRRHPEWEQHHVRWRWLRESYEGGEAYRRATYGSDFAGFARMNLIRHKHEVPTGSVVAGRNLGAAEDRNFWLRLERTPPPSMMSEAIETHLSEIYSREIERSAGTAVEAWWEDVDGSGTAIAEWMGDTVAPYLMALGCLDLLFDRPRVPKGETVATKADQARLKLDRCVATMVLPECVVWWRSDPVTGRYLEAVVESCEDTGKTYRHWTETGSTLYDGNGNKLEEISHGYGRVPMVRVFDRKRPTCKGVGVPRYEPIAELQREAYNRESELVLTGAMLSHPTVQAPEEYIGENAEIPIGPGFVLPKKKAQGGAGQVTYEPWEYMDPPATGAESNRADLDRIREQVDRAAKLTKPAGASGTGKGTVSQSGISKALDQKSGNALLGKIAVVLEKVERTAAEFAGVVLGEEGDPQISYPRSFNLLSADELAAITVEIQGIIAAAGDLPTAEAALLKSLVREALAGIDEDELESIEREIDEALEEKAADKAREREALKAAGPMGLIDGNGEPGAAAGAPAAAATAGPANAG